MAKKKPISEERFEECPDDIVKTAQLLSAAGATQKKIAQILKVPIWTIRKWKKNHKEFKDALNKGKEGARITLAFEGLKRAIGYDFVETGQKPIRVKDDDGNFVYENHTYTYTRHQAGDPKLLMFMLECIDRYLGGETWKAKNKLEIEATSKTPLKLEAAQAIQIAELAGKLKKKYVDSEEIIDEDKD